ncbi:D-lactate dehydrogenase, partial [Acinetobacter nosocomialis]
DIENERQCCASDHRYIKDVAKVDENTPARFNADPSRLFEASGSAGKVCVFAVRLDTFERISSQVFYVGSNHQEDLTKIRRFLLKDLPRIPIAGEYIHRVAYDIGAEYGKDTFMFIEKFGTAKVPAAFA